MIWRKGEEEEDAEDLTLEEFREVARECGAGSGGGSGGGQQAAERGRAQPRGRPPHGENGKPMVWDGALSAWQESF